MIVDRPRTEGVDVLRENDLYIESLQTAVDQGEFSLDHIPSLITKIVRESRWQHRWVRALQREVSFSRFTDFVAAKTPSGLGASIEMLERMCSDDPVALDLIDQATTRPRGGDNGNQYTGGKVDNINLAKGSLGPDGTSAQHAIRKLRKDRPDLHAKVLAKELSPHAAMVEAGFRRKTVSVPVDDPDKVSAFLAKHFDATEIRAIADLAVFLTEGEG